MTDEPLNIRLAGPEWQPPKYGDAPESLRRRWWKRLGEISLHVKRVEILRGIGASGAPLKPVKRVKGGPPLIPHGVSSRTYRLLDQRSGVEGATLFWHGGWKTIMGYHAYKHGPRSLPVRDTIGISPDGAKRAMRVALGEWKTWRAELEAMGSDGVRYVPSPAAETHGEVVVELDLGLLMASLSSEDLVSEASARPGSLEAARRAIKAARTPTGRPLMMPRLGFDQIGRPVVIDGRHRLLELYRAGVETVLVTVRRSDAARVRARFGFTRRRPSIYRPRRAKGGS